MRWPCMLDLVDLIGPCTTVGAYYCDGRTRLKQTIHLMHFEKAHVLGQPFIQLICDGFLPRRQAPMT